MPISTYEKDYLLKALRFKVDKKELFRNINNIGLVIKRENKDEIDIEFKASRPDLISVIGLARALRYFMRRSRDFKYETKDGRKDFVISVGSHVSSIRPVIASLVVEKMKLGEEDLRDIINFTDKLSENYGRQRKKIAIGLHDLKNVKPPFYYDAYEDEEFVPLNRDRKMKYSEVLKKEEKGIKYGSLLGESKRRYVILKDSIGAMALVPVINSDRTKVTTSTKSMIIDITGATRHLIEKVAEMLAADFIDRGFDVYRVRVDYADRSCLMPRMERRMISVRLEQLEREIGVRIGFNNAILLANKMGYEASLIGSSIHFAVPAYRLDVINEQDVIEDVAVAYGYDYIRPVPIPATEPGSIEAKSKAHNTVSEAMVGLGFSEVMNSYLTNMTKNFRLMRLKEQSYIKLSNPKTEIATMMRTWLIPSLLECIGKSMHDKLPQRIFELDIVFGLKNDRPEETYRLAAAVCDAKVNFNEMKGNVEALGRVLGVDLAIKRFEHDSFISGRCAQIISDGRRVGFFGELHPEVLSGFGVEEPVLAFETDLSMIA